MGILAKIVLSGINLRYAARTTSFRFRLARLTLADINANPKATINSVAGKHERALDLVSNMDALSKAGESESPDQRWGRIVRFYDCLLLLLKERGIFEGRTLIYPAAGIDVLPSRHIKAIMLDISHERMRDIGHVWKYDKEKIAGLNYISGFDAEKVTNYPDLSGQKKIVLFKGVRSYMGAEASYLEMLYSYLESGDRILILDASDGRRFAPRLIELGMRPVEDWIDTEMRKSVMVSLKLLSSGRPLEFSPAGTVFIAPNDLVILEKE